MVGFSVKQTALQNFAGSLKFRLPLNLRKPIRKAIAQVLQCVTGHVGTFVARARDARHWMVAMPWQFAL
jgi:hypothetical protein